MSVDYFVMYIDGVEIVVYCSPWPMPPKGCSMVYEKGVVGKVSRECLSNAPKDVDEVKAIIKTVKDNPTSGWDVGSFHMEAEEFEALRANHRKWVKAVLKKVCECGAEKCKQPKHSPWCPKA